MSWETVANVSKLVVCLSRMILEACPRKIQIALALPQLSNMTTKTSGRASGVSIKVIANFVSTERTHSLDSNDDIFIERWDFLHPGQECRLQAHVIYMIIKLIYIYFHKLAFPWSSLLPNLCSCFLCLTYHWFHFRACRLWENWRQFGSANKYCICSIILHCGGTQNSISFRLFCDDLVNLWRFYMIFKILRCLQFCCNIKISR